MGKQFIASSEWNLSSSYKFAGNKTPIIIHFKHNANPLPFILDFAEEKGFKDNIDCIAMGQGKGKWAEKMIFEKIEKGGWVILQDIYLGRSWFKKLTEIVDSLENRISKK